MFFQKMKRYFGYGILDIDVQCPNKIDRNQPVVKGKLVINAKQDEFVERVKMKVSEVWQKKDVNGNPVQEEFQLGIPLSLVKSMDDRLRDKGGVLGAVGKMSSMLKSEKSNFWLTTTVDVQSAGFEPNKTIELFLN